MWKRLWPKRISVQPRPPRALQRALGRPLRDEFEWISASDSRESWSLLREENNYTLHYQRYLQRKPQGVAKNQPTKSAGLAENLVKELRTLSLEVEENRTNRLHFEFDGRYEYQWDEQGQLLRRLVVDADNTKSVGKERKEKEWHVVWSSEWMHPNRDKAGGPLVSPCGRYVAWLEKESGWEDGELIVRHLNEAGTVIKFTGRRCLNMVWHQLGHGLLYSTLNAQMRPSAVYYHALDGNEIEATLLDNHINEPTLLQRDMLNDHQVYTEHDDEWMVDVGLSKCQSYFLLSSRSRTSSEIWVHRADQNQLIPQHWSCLRPRQPQVDYYCDHYKGRWFLLETKADVKHKDMEISQSSTPSMQSIEVSKETKRQDHFQLWYLDSSEPPPQFTASSSSAWKRVAWQLPSNERLEDVDVFHRRLALYTRCSNTGRPGLWWSDFTNLYPIDLPAPLLTAGTLMPGINRDAHASGFHFMGHWMGVLERLYWFDFESQQLRVDREVTVPRVVRDVKLARILISSQDGTRVPVTLAFHRSIENRVQSLFQNQSAISADVEKSSATEKNVKEKAVHVSDLSEESVLQPLPVLLSAYGSYGMATDPPMELHHVPLLDRGWLLAVAHVRGGGELGRAWYDQGRRLGKQNGIQDVLSAADYITHRVKGGVRLHGLGRSAGGFLMAAALSRSWQNMEFSKEKEGANAERRVELNSFRSMILQVPFLDPWTAMTQDHLPLTTVDYIEWGKPMENAQDAENLQRISPYNTIPYGNEQTAKADLALAPSLLLTAGGKDQRVPYWHSLKYVSRLRHRLPQWYGGPAHFDKDGVVLLSSKPEGDHFVDSEGADVEDVAFGLAFLLHENDKK